MSHYTQIRTKLRDADILLSALKSLGFDEVEAYDTPQTLYGFGGIARPEQAEIIIRRAHNPSATNDIGFARQPDGCFDAIIDDLNRWKFNEAWLTELSRSYGHFATLEYARTHGYEVATDDLQQDGSRRLTLRRAT